MIGTRIHITGIVQGVGFRPFVYNLAVQQGLTGWVCNTSAGVDIEVHGDAGEISTFIQSLESDAPPLARIDSIDYRQIPGIDAEKFEIITSQAVSNAFQPISPDIGICPDCQGELNDPADRRYRYPFINCTNCGPRLTIIEDIPYDRPYTTMKAFIMCPECDQEYTDPTNRRFHAQPVACPECGPHIWLEAAAKKVGSGLIHVADGDDALISAQNLLLKGNIVAIKGLGGFHLACDATNSKAAAELRKRKLRVDKPFALMMRDISTINEHCFIDQAEHELLESVQRPIVIAARRKSSTIANEVAPGQNTLGVMLPYTPLHHLIFTHPDRSKNANKPGKSWKMPPLVMTSGNISEEPIAMSNEEAREKLIGLADAFLLHDRLIRTRCDDSVMRTFQGASFPLRRSRGYAPFPVYLTKASRHVLAVGAELKNTFCIVREGYAFMSHHVGDMENVETYDSFVDSIHHYESLFRIKPEAIAYDLHPDYLASRYAIERSKRENLLAIGVQHHHAHIVSCMAENGLAGDRPVIGVAFDGTGYGDDGSIWGGEFMLADYRQYKRLGQLKYNPLPGGDTAIRKPARTALAYLWANQLEWDPAYPPVDAICAEERSVIKSQLAKKINTPLTSSMGRFFDAIASMAGVRQHVNYEAQAAIEFETLIDPDESGAYQLPIETASNPDETRYQINPAPLIEEVLVDLSKGTKVSTISARFHNSVAAMVGKMCMQLRNEHAVDDVVLSGGVWQNMALLERTYKLLLASKFNVHIHRQVPTNDGGLALGQAVVAVERMAG